MTAENAKGVPVRRRLLNFLLGLGLSGFFANMLYPVLRYLRPPDQPTAAGPIKLNAQQLAQIDREGFCIARIGAHKILVFNGGGELRALDARCTHEGCTVQFVPGESIVYCACHNGKYDLNGQVLSGPPPRPLEQWVTTREGDNVIIGREPT